MLASMLTAPNVDSPINNEACNQYKNNKAEFEKNAKEYIKNYCK